jgi:hypothetical protein
MISWRRIVLVEDAAAVAATDLVPTECNSNLLAEGYDMMTWEEDVRLRAASTQRDQQTHHARVAQAR